MAAKLYLNTNDPHTGNPRYIDLDKIRFTDASDQDSPYFYIAFPLVIENDRTEIKKMYAVDGNKRRDAVSGVFVPRYIMKEGAIPTWDGYNYIYQESDYELDEDGNRQTNPDFDTAKTEREFFRDLQFSGKYGEQKEIIMSSLLLALEPTGRYDIKNGR